MPVTINGDGNITGLSVGGLGSGVVNTATLANGAATGAKLGLPSGSVIQVINLVKTDPVSLTMTTSFQDISGFTISITPTSANSKIILSGSIVLESHQQYCFGKFIRSINGGSYSSPTGWLGDGSGSRQQSQFGNNFRSPGSPDAVTPCPMAIYAVDTDHNTTNSINYKLQYKNHAGSSYTINFNRSHSDANNNYNPRSCSHLTLMEIKG